MPKPAVLSHFRWRQDYNGSTVLSPSRLRGVTAVCHTLVQHSKSGEAFPLPSQHATTLALIRSPSRLTQRCMAQSRLIKPLHGQPSIFTEATLKPVAMATRRQPFFPAEGLIITT